MAGGITVRFLDANLRVGKMAIGEVSINVHISAHRS